MYVDINNVAGELHINVVRYYEVEDPVTAPLSIECLARYLARELVP
jgi:hypothetical protein